MSQKFCNALQNCRIRSGFGWYISIMSKPAENIFGAFDVKMTPLISLASWNLSICILSSVRNSRLRLFTGNLFNLNMTYPLSRRSSIWKSSCFGVDEATLSCFKRFDVEKKRPFNDSEFFAKNVWKTLVKMTFFLV